MAVTKVTSIRMSPGLNKDIKVLSKHYNRTENEQMIWMLERQVQQEKGAIMSNHPCIISVALSPDEENEKMIDHLRSMFGYVQIEKRVQGGAIEALCAAPKGLSYDEAFILLQKKYYDVGWVYADAVPRLPQDVEVAR